jgi:hypothetical protein
MPAKAQPGTGEPAAPEPTVTVSAPVAEPSVADLGRIIGRQPAAAAPAKKPVAAKPAPAPEITDDDLDDDDDPTALDPAAPAAGEDDPAAPAADDPAAPAAEDDPAAAPAPAAAAEPEDLELDAEDQAARKGFTPAQQGRFDKAIRKQRTKVTTLEGQLAERDQALEALAAAPAVAAVPTAEDPLADVEDDATLATRLQQSRNLWKWARLHPQGGTLKDASNRDVEITPERALEIQVEEEELQQLHGPRRAQFIKDRSTQEASAIQAHPWLKNKSSQGAVEIEAMLRRNPGLRSVPGIKLILADHLAHRGTRRAKPATPAAAKAAAVPVAPATPAGRGNPPPRVGGAAKLTTTALKTVAETGRDPGNAALGALIGKRSR